MITINSIRKPIESELEEFDEFVQRNFSAGDGIVAEMLEYVLSYLSNTVSFLRVGAFVLVHAGMMMVVFALMDSVGTIGSPIVFVIGNVFVMCLEGLIVGIQALRLEFYELFGRFYSGTGVPYQPFTVHFRREKKS